MPTVAVQSAMLHPLSLRTLAIGLASGVVAWGVGLPLPWMLGPMIGATLAALSQVNLKSPDKLRPIVIPVIGVMLGAGFSPDMLDVIGGWVATLVLLVPFLAAAGAVSFFVYRRAGGYDPITAFFSAMPGGLNEMLIVGEEAGGDAKRIALAHATRILIVIVCVALFFGLVLDIRADASASNYTTLTALSLADYLILIACAVVGTYMGSALKLPAAPVMGPMTLSAIVHITGLVHEAPPSLIVIAAQVIMGTTIGCRFKGTTFAEVGRDLRLGALSSVSMIGVAVAFATLVSVTGDVSLAQAFLALSPGGLTEMSLLALAMGQDVAYVGVMHIVRIALVIFAAPYAFRGLRRVLGTR